MFPMVSTLNAWTTAPTTTSLAITAKNGPVTSITAGSAVTLTATVSTGTAPVTVGQVNFCDATAASCTDIHLLGTAQLTSAGTASIKLTPAIGSHSYEAVFAGTPHGTVSTAGSTSVPVALSVTGLWPSGATLVGSGNPGNYTLTATAGGSANTAPTGSISFLDSSDNNAVLGTAPLVANTAGLSFLYSLSFPQTDLYPRFSPTQFAVGDFNADGIPDIAQATSSGCLTGSCADPIVTTFLGDGHGNFMAAAKLDLTKITDDMSVIGVSDFNGDGIPDLLVGDGTGYADNGTQTVTALLGTGTGTFTVAESTPTGGEFGSIAIADFNGDGIPDVAVANTTANLITFLLGKGDGTFVAASVAPASTNSNIIATADFNGDGVPDLVGINYFNSDTATVLLGNGDGTFTQVTSGPATGGSPTSIALGDFNGDGKTDLAFPNSATGTLTVLLGNGDGTFTPAASSPITLWAAGENEGTGIVLVGDFNGDGKTDLVIQSPQSGGDNGLTLLGDGMGGFAVAAVSLRQQVIGINGAPEISGYPTLSLAATGDFNGDGRTDLAGVQTVLIAATQTATATLQGLATPVATGNHQVLASYSGDTTYTGSNSGTLTLAAALGTPTVAVSSSASQVFTGTTVTLTATVTGSGLTPTGTVRFYAGSNLLGAGTLNGSGVATCTTSNLPVGNYNVTASYVGDTNYNAANSPATVVVVAAPGTGTPTLTVTPSASNVTDQQNVTVAVTLSGASGQPTPTGVLALSIGSYKAQQPLANGAASFTIDTGVLANGSNTITVTYLGDATYKSVNATSTVTVSSIVVAVSSPASVMPGTAGTATATLSASSTYSGTMKLTCALTNSPAGAQSLPTCSLNPASVAITAGGNGTAALNMQTTAASNTAMMHPSGLGLLGFGGGSILAGLIMLGVPSRRRRWMSMLGLLLVIFVAGTIGCGGGSNSKPPSNPGTPATTAGNYTFTVTGTDSATSSITASTTVTLTVQ
jgi:hypothetical protein